MSGLLPRRIERRDLRDRPPAAGTRISEPPVPRENRIVPSGPHAAMGYVEGQIGELCGVAPSSDTVFNLPSA